MGQVTMVSGPLDGILVVSIEQAIAAPYCTRQLADLGARVIKVERPDVGDFARAYDTRARGLASHFVWANRSKESLTLNLKRGPDIVSLQRLIAKADVFVQNLAPGALARLGVDLNQERKVNKNLVTCSISGYGVGGEWEKRKAYDLLVQAEAGFLSITGTTDFPSKAGISIADIAAGTSAFQGILGSLLQRARTNEGGHLDISMLEAMTEWMGYPLYYAMDGGTPPTRTGAGHATIYPYGVYKTLDGTVLFGLQNDREWKSFTAHVLGRPDLGEDPASSGNGNRVNRRDVLDPIICGILAGLTTDEALKRLDKAAIGTARVNDMKAVWQHPQLTARGRWQDIETAVGKLPSLIPPSTGNWTPQMGPVPELGEHNEAIIREFSLNHECL